MTHPGGISRVPSLETSLFSGLDDSKDVDAQRAIAALAAQLQGGDASRGGPPNPSSMVPPRPFPPSAPTATSSPIPMKPLPPSFHTFLDVNIKREVKDDQKYRQIIEALLRFVNGKLSQDMALKMIQAHAGREITVAIITQGIKEKIFTQQKPNPNPSMAPSPSPASPAVSSTPTGMNPALAAMYNAPKQTFYPSGLPSSGVPSPIDPKKTLITPGGASVMGRTYVPPGNPLMSNPTLTQIGMMGSIPPHLNVPGFVGGFNPMFKMNPNPFVGKPGMPTIPPTIPGLPMFGNMANMPKKAMIKEEDNEKRIAASFKDVTDVTRLAGLDIKQEASSILQEVTESKEAVEEPAFLTMSLLKKKMTEMATRAGLKSVQEEAIQFTTIAVQEYMRTIIEALSQISSQRADLHKHELPIRIVQDPKHLLRQHHIKKAEEDKKRKAEAELQNDEYKKIRDDPKNLLNQAAKNPAVPTVTFTQQNLAQLQELRNLVSQGKQLDPQQQKTYLLLKTQLQKLHQTQQQQKEENSNLLKPGMTTIKSNQASRVGLRDIQFAIRMLNLKLGKRRKKASTHLY